MKMHIPFQIPTASLLPREIVDRVKQAGITLEIDVPDADWIKHFKEAVVEDHENVGSLAVLLDPEHEKLFTYCANLLCAFSDRDARANLSRSLQSVREIVEKYGNDKIDERLSVIEDLKGRPRSFFNDYPAANYGEAECCKRVVAQFDEIIKLLESQIRDLKEGTRKALRDFRADTVGRTRVNTWLRDCCGALFVAFGKSGPSRDGVKWTEVAALVQAAYLSSGRENEIDSITGECVKSWIKSVDDSPLLLSPDVAAMYTAKEKFPLRPAVKDFSELASETP
jgi:hypothetical protein